MLLVSIKVTAKQMTAAKPEQAQQHAVFVLASMFQIIL